MRRIFELTEAELDAKLDRLVTLVTELRDESAPALRDRAGLAKALSCSVKTLDRLREDPTFPELMLLDSPRFELPAVLAWLRARNATPGLKLVGGGK